MLGNGDHDSSKFNLKTYKSGLYMHDMSSSVVNKTIAVHSRLSVFVLNKQLKNPSKPYLSQTGYI